MLYLVGWRTGEARTGGFSAIILYDKTDRAADLPQTQVGGFGLYGVNGNLDIESLTRDITARVRNEYDRAENAVLYCKVTNLE